MGYSNWKFGSVYLKGQDFFINIEKIKLINKAKENKIYMKNDLFLISCLILIMLILLPINVVSLSPPPVIYCDVEGEIVDITYKIGRSGSFAAPGYPNRYSLDIKITSVNEHIDDYRDNQVNQTDECPEHFTENEVSSIYIADEEDVDEYELTAGNKINGTAKRWFKFRFEEYDVTGDESAPVDESNIIIRWFTKIYQTIIVLFFG